MFDQLAGAPPGIAEYAAGLRNLTNRQLFDRVAAIVARSGYRYADPQLEESIRWTLACEVAELERRLQTWLAVNPAVLPAHTRSGICPKCGKADAKVIYHSGIDVDPESICWMRLETGREHLHRLCKTCRYEWLEDTEKQPPERSSIGS